MAALTQRRPSFNDRPWRDRRRFRGVSYVPAITAKLVHKGRPGVIVRGRKSQRVDDGPCIEENIGLNFRQPPAFLPQASRVAQKDRDVDSAVASPRAREPNNATRSSRSP